MPIGLQKMLNTFPFERTIDWRVGFPDLYNMEGGLFAEYLMKEGWCLAKSINLPVSNIDVEKEQGIEGFYTSKIVVPTLRVEIYPDSKGILENALMLWNTASFDADGFMPTYVKEKKVLSDFAVQAIRVQRISPINMTKALQAIQGTKDNEMTYKNEVFEDYTFRGYLSRIPDYAGNSSGSVRTLLLEFRVVSMEREPISKIKSALKNLKMLDELSQEMIPKTRR